MVELRSAEIRLPCGRCGTAVLMPAGTAHVPMGCDRCRSGAERGVGYTIIQGGVRVVLDLPSMVQRAQSGELQGWEYVRADGGAWMPAAEQPALRHLFFPGVSFTAPEPAGRRLSVPWAGLGAVAFVASVGLGVWAWVDNNPVVEHTVLPPEPAKPVVTLVDTTMTALTTRIGEVREPKGMLLAGAWTARLQGDEDGLAEAVRLAERAAVRMPDVETLGTLAMLYFETDALPELRDAVLRRAQKLNLDHPAVVRAELAQARHSGRREDAQALAVRCLDLDATDLWCAVQTVHLTDFSGASERLAAWKHVASGPGRNVGLVLRETAKAAIAAESVDAEALVSTALAASANDAELLGYQAILKLRLGNLKAPTATACRLEDRTPAPLRIALAGYAIGAGQPAEAREWILPLAVKEPTDRDERFWVRLHSAQIDYLEARANPGNMAGAAEAASAALLQQPRNPTAAQLRMLAALATGDLVEARKALGNAEITSLPGPDAAQIHLTAVEIDLASKTPRDALPRIEAAQSADPALPDVWLWSALVALEGRDPNAAVAALRLAITRVDGSTSRRNPLRYAMPQRADSARAGSLLAEQMEGRAGLERDYTVAKAALAWLGGDSRGALRDLERILSERTDPEGLVLAARILLDDGRAPEALPLVEAAAGARPKAWEFQLLRARCLSSLGRAAEAERALAYVRGAGSQSVGFHLYRLAQGAGRQAALDALAIDPYNLVAAEAL